MEIILNPVAINIYLTILQNSWLTYIKPMEKHELELVIFKTHRSHIETYNNYIYFTNPWHTFVQSLWKTILLE